MRGQWPALGEHPRQTADGVHAGEQRRPVAGHGAGQVHRYLPDGTLDTVVTVGAKQTTACALGGEDLRTLYITTSRENLPDHVQPTAGSLYAVRVAVPGQVTAAFGG